MIRKVFISIGAVLFLGLVFFFFGLGPIVDGQRNAVYPSELARNDDTASSFVSEDVRRFHQSLFVADLHADSLCWDRNLLKRNDRGHLDLPRMQEGGMALQVWTVFSKIPRGINVNSNPSDSDLMPLLALSERWPISAWFSPKGRALHLADRAQSIEQRSQGELLIIRSKSDLRSLIASREKGENTVGILLGLEGAHALEDGVSDIDTMFDSGYRLIGLVHFFDNRYGGSSAGEEKGGLTDEGRSLIRAMEEKGMVVDLAHASPRLIEDTLSVSKRPLVVSHTGLKSQCESPRNLSDAQLRSIANHGGIIGIGYWKEATCGENVKAIIRSIVYAVNLVGAEHVALGSDFDGSTTTPLDGSQLAVITASLLDEGLSEKEVRLIMGENFQRILMETLPD